jgi:hypothetical protein
MRFGSDKGVRERNKSIGKELGAESAPNILPNDRFSLIAVLSYTPQISPLFETKLEFPMLGYRYERKLQ